MDLDPDLLAAARTMSDRFSAAERQAELARADYHTAVRRLHLAGSSLREIASALSISHQRVQQIVDAAGGSWWRRAWGSRSQRPDTVCRWCGRSPAEVKKLVAGPRVFICDRCVAAAETALAGTARPPFATTTSRTARCSFCGKRGGRDRQIASSDLGHVCSKCVTTCREIMDAATTTPSVS
jgi:hypothetical protein